MLTMRAILLTVLSFVLASSVHAQLPKQQQPLTHTDDAQQYAKPDERGTEQAPLIIKVLPPLNETEKTAADKQERQDKSKSDWSLVGLTGILAIIGVIQIVVFSLQARRLRQTVEEMKIATKATEKAAAAAEHTVSVMKENAERQLRAYLSVEAQMNTFTISGDPLKAKVTIKNCGQTPAYDVTQIMGMALGQSFDTIPPPQGPGGITTAAIAPGGINEQFQSGNVLPPAAISALQNNQMTLWVYGEVNYTDVFNVKRFIKYRFMVGGPVGFNGTSMCICEEGNEQN